MRIPPQAEKTTNNKEKKFATIKIPHFFLDFFQMFFTATGLYAAAIITFMLLAKFKPLKFDLTGKDNESGKEKEAVIS